MRASRDPHYQHHDPRQRVRGEAPTSAPSGPSPVVHGRREGTPTRTSSVLMSSELEGAFASARASSLAIEDRSEAELRAEARARIRQGRLRNIESYTGNVKAADVDRIANDEVDSEVYLRGVLPFQRLWEARKKNMLWIGGSPGVGKTVAALTMLATHGGMLIEAPELARAMRVNTDFAEKMREHAKRARVLVLDDVGYGATEAKRIASRDAQEPYIFELVNARLHDSKATILISNLKRAEIEALYSAPLLSRVASATGGIIEASGQDRRRQAPEKSR